MSEVKNAVRKTLNKYVEASNNGDAEAFKAILLEDVELNPSGHPAVIGREAAGEWAQREFFDQADVNLELFPQSIEEVNSAVHVSGTFSIDMSPKDGSADESVTGAFYSIFREDDDGVWKYKYSMYNFDKPMN